MLPACWRSGEEGKDRCPDFHRPASVCNAGILSFLLLSVWVTEVPVNLFLFTATCLHVSADTHTHTHTQVYTDPEQSPHSASDWNFLLLLS